jgi:predicted amino acid dehydrogenase
VVKTAIAALAHAGRDLGELTVAWVGLGSIGRSSLELLLARVGSPRRLLLCDVAGRARHVAEIAAELTADCQSVDVCHSGASLPLEVYDADLVIAATSTDRWILEVDRLRAGTVVVDDSFPHCFDAAAAIRRMQRQGDVLVVGGGLLGCAPSEQEPAADLVLPAGAEQALRSRLRDTIASCQIESLLHVGRPDLPLVHGLVDRPLALAYWEALADVPAAPLHLLQHVVSPESLMRFAQH